MIVAVFGVWAIVLQSLLPTAGALAAQSGNGLLIELCTTAGIQTVFAGGEDEPGEERPGPSKNSAGCDVCVTCGCSAGAGTCATMGLFPNTAGVWVAWLAVEQITHVGAAMSGFRARGPPVG